MAAAAAAAALWYVRRRAVAKHLLGEQGKGPGVRGVRVLDRLLVRGQRPVLLNDDALNASMPNRLSFVGRRDGAPPGNAKAAAVLGGGSAVMLPGAWYLDLLATSSKQSSPHS